MAKGKKKKLVKKATKVPVKKKKTVKKKETGKELVIAAVGPKAEKNLRMTKNKIKKLKELGGEFKKDLPSIFNLIDNYKDSKSIQLAYYKAALAVVVDIIPVLETKAAKTKWDRDILALNATLDQGMQILANVQALDESKNIIHRIVGNVIDPSYMALAHMYVSSLASLREEISTFIPKENEMEVRKQFQKISTDFAEYLDTSRAALRDAFERELT